MLSPNQETLNYVRKLGKNAENFETLFSLTEGFRTESDSRETSLHISSVLEEGNAYRLHQTKQNFGTFYRAIVGFLLARN